MDRFCYLGEMITAGGGCKAATLTRYRTTWGKFKELLPLLSSKCLSLLTRGHVENYLHCTFEVLFFMQVNFAP